MSIAALCAHLLFSSYSFYNFIIKPHVVLMNEEQIMLHNLM